MTLPLTEAGLQKHVDEFLGWSYSLPDPRFRRSLIPGFKMPLAPPKQTNCCSFVQDVVIGAAREIDPTLKWVSDDYQRSMLWAGRRAFDPVEVLVARGLAEWPEGQDTTPVDWSVMHGWKSKAAMDARRGGHTFFIARVRTGHVLTVEANDGYQVSGVGSRGLGNLTGPVADRLVSLWQQAMGPQAWSLNRLLQTYPERRWAALRIPR